jgi:hypothetical protein
MQKSSKTSGVKLETITRAAAATEMVMTAGDTTLTAKVSIDLGSHAMCCWQFHDFPELPFLSCPAAMQLLLSCDNYHYYQETLTHT